MAFLEILTFLIYRILEHKIFLHSLSNRSNNFFLFSKLLRPVVKSAQSPAITVGAVPRVKQPGREADHLPLCTTEVNNASNVYFRCPI